MTSTWNSARQWKTAGDKVAKGYKLKAFMRGQFDFKTSW